MSESAHYPSLHGKRVFVTGGATGIGAAIVLAFAEQGAKVGFIDVDAAASAALCKSVEEKSTGNARYTICDATNTEALQSSVREFSALSGGLDALVNNVANDTRHDFHSMTPDAWRKCLAVNLDATFFASQIAAGQMGDGGSIVNMSSINALLGPANMAGYVAAKSGLLGLTKAMAKEFGADGIRVNAVLPGWVATERQLALWLTAEAEAKWQELTPLEGRILPSDVANLVLFLVADDSSKITGQQFVIDGGRT